MRSDPPTVMDDPSGGAYYYYNSSAGYYGGTISILVYKVFDTVPVMFLAVSSTVQRTQQGISSEGAPSHACATMYSS